MLGYGAPPGRGPTRAHRQRARLRDARGCTPGKGAHWWGPVADGAACSLPERLWVRWRRTPENRVQRHALQCPGVYPGRLHLYRVGVLAIGCWLSAVEIDLRPLSATSRLWPVARCVVCGAGLAGRAKGVFRDRSGTDIEQGVAGHLSGQVRGTGRPHRRAQQSKLPRFPPG